MTDRHPFLLDSTLCQTENLMNKIAWGDRMKEIPYRRADAVQYARRWALKRNANYYNFEYIGGDCTNFASQCLFAGAGTMNYTPTYGWYYRSLSDRSPAWSGVKYLYNFLVNNKSAGPYGHVVSQKNAEPGDLVQLGKSDGHFYHTSVITEVSPVILVCAHSYDAVDRPLYSYDYEAIRFLHIDGAR